MTEPPARPESTAKPAGQIHSSSQPASPHARRTQATVLLDMGPAVHQRAGLSRYAHALAGHLPAQGTTDLDFVFFYNRHSGNQFPQDLPNRPVAAIPLGQYGWRLGALAGQLLKLSLPPVLPAVQRQTGIRPALYHATEHLLPYVNIPSVLTVHDLIFEWLPEYHTRWNRAFLRLAMPRFLRAASAIIAVSAHTAHDIVARYHMDTKKIHIVYEGVDAQFQPAGAATVRRIRDTYAEGAPYLLMVGTLEPRKNHALALHALKRLRTAGRPHRLVIAGGHGWLFDSVQTLVEELELGDAVVFTGYVPAQDLPALYTGADCFLLPSLYEGFGFPALEAMACGAPVVCSKVSSLPEVAGDAALFISPHDDEQLAAAVERILTDPELARTLRRRGLARAARFRWDDTAAQTIDVYRAVLAASQAV